MIHNITTVALNHFLDLDIALEVAKTSNNVWMEPYGYVTNSFKVDAFIAEVKTTQGDRTGDIRMREINRAKIKRLFGESFFGNPVTSMVVDSDPVLSGLLAKHGAEIIMCLSWGKLALTEDTYLAFYEYFLNSGEMPYGVAKARDGDPHDWVWDHIEQLFEGITYA